MHLALLCGFVAMYPSAANPGSGTGPGNKCDDAEAWLACRHRVAAAAIRGVPAVAPPYSCRMEQLLEGLNTVGVRPPPAAHEGQCGHLVCWVTSRAAVPGREGVHQRGLRFRRFALKPRTLQPCRPGGCARRGGRARCSTHSKAAAHMLLPRCCTRRAAPCLTRCAPCSRANC